ncbi:MAG: SpoIID/LytB domain-containing protein [Pseudomonadota bacterium]
MPEPVLRVGLIQGREVLEIELHGPFHLGSDGDPRTGRWRAQRGPAGVTLTRHGASEPTATGAVLRLRPVEGATFLLRGMTVGVGFHWQHEEDLAFAGELSLEAREVGLDAVNAVPLEDYLRSVISSEMSATCPPALLEAHAVISRSWLLAQLEARGEDRPAPPGASVEGQHTRIVRWYDREDHTFFDVCADDHCQRYQGVTRAFTPEASAAVEATRGLVLRSRGRTCDARFSKSCGGMTELFSSAWGDTDPPYLQAFPDLPAGEAPGFALPLTEEENASAFIAGAPPAFCCEADRALLTRLLPALDHDTRDFYRWEVVIGQEELQDLLRRKLGLELGPVRALIPLERGPSGRLTRLRIEGTAGSAEIGKELEIRRALSATHLYSSAFVVHPEGSEGGVPAAFRLRGAGWGHGVGLCQIGAAVMAERGYDFRAILAHYYRGAELGRGY